MRAAGVMERVPDDRAGHRAPRVRRDAPPRSPAVRGHLGPHAARRPTRSRSGPASARALHRGVGRPNPASATATHPPVSDDGHAGTCCCHRRRTRRSTRAPRSRRRRSRAWLTPQCAGARMTTTRRSRSSRPSATTRHGRSRRCTVGPASRSTRSPRPQDVLNLRNVRPLPRALAAFLVLLGVAALGHALVTSVRRRRHELAVLRADGLHAPPDRHHDRRAGGDRGDRGTRASGSRSGSCWAVCRGSGSPTPRRSSSRRRWPSR